MANATARRSGPRSYKPPRRRTKRRGLKSLAAFGIVGWILGVPSASNARPEVAQPTQSQLSMSLTLSTPNLKVGPFDTSHTAPVTIDSNGTARLPTSALSFETVAMALPANREYTVALLQTSDIATTVNPTTGAAAISGDFSMQWQVTGSNVVCQAGPFHVNATTEPYGASPYATASGAATVLDAAPNIPAVSTSCDRHSSSINTALSLPIESAPSAATTSGSTTVANPAVELHVRFSPAIEPPPPPKGGSTGTTPTLRPPPPAPLVNPAPAHTEHGAPTNGTGDAHARKNSTPTSTTTSSTAAIDDPSSVDAVFGAIGPVDPLTPPSAPNVLNDVPVAIEPATVSARDGSSSPGPLLLLIATAGAVALALSLIARDVRRILPAGSRRQRFGGPVGTSCLQ